ncbi:MAG: DUF4383 domain-containing protein [Segniliparus sp.]|uniref:DUF4383 domain-containing protein n=1 Tax=Segniliparus sp. TaxID=2804064 RepID=UPI003F37C9EE
MAVLPALSRRIAGIRRSPEQLFLLAMAVWFTSNGPVAYAMCPSFSFGHSMQSCTIMLLGFIPVTVNGWHALFHFVTGVVGLAQVRKGPRAALVYGLVCGQVYLVVGALGLAGGTNVLGFMAVDAFGNWVHVVEGLLVLAPVTVLAVGGSIWGGPRRSRG